ncbi:MAG: hypothetical protein KC478_15165, partial [Bacteriovoracaceae bacterium]|nr:hypothetical protein [Bacteriovoracaceae bacterium]
MSALAKDPSVSWSGNLYKKAYEYKSLHRKFSNAVCTPGTDHKYYKFLRNYRGAGFYLPLIDNDIDRQAIKKNLSHFKKKIAYIKNTAKKLEKMEKLPSFTEVSDPLRENLRNLLNFKKEFSQKIGQDKKDKLRAQSNAELKLLKKNMDIFFSKIFFFKSYNFPNDHLKNRRVFELHKHKEDIASRKKANAT